MSVQQAEATVAAEENFKTVIFQHKYTKKSPWFQGDFFVRKYIIQGRK